MRTGDYPHSGVLLPLEAFDDGCIRFDTGIPENNTKIEDWFDKTLVRETQGLLVPPILTLNCFHDVDAGRV
jgi:hypothetical protein